MRNIHIILTLLITQLALAQSTPFYKSYSWDENPMYKAGEDMEPLKGVKDKYVIEFIYTEDGSLTEYYLEHKVLWLNSDDNIETYNKVYLPYSSNSELLESKARVITEKGNVIELDNSKIFVAQDEETGSNYKYFAFEGVEKGSFIEYYFVEKRYPKYKGTAFRLQASYDKKDVAFELYSPENLIFNFKSYNNLPEVVKDTMIVGKLHWKLYVDYIPGLIEEDQSPYQASRGTVIYKLDSNLKNSMSDISSYGIVSQNVYEYYYTSPTKKEGELLKKVVSESIGNNDKLEEEEIIKTIDRYIKSNVYLSKGKGDEEEDLTYILDKNIANTTGMIKLYIAFLEYLNIEHELVLTSDREQLKFDKDFEANNFLTDFLIYFPTTNKYLSPTETGSRYGFPPGELTDNYGLFIKEISVGDFKSGIGKIKYIEPVLADKTIDRMIISVRFDENDLSKNLITLDRSFTGYYALPIHPYMRLVKEKDKDELIQGLARSMNSNVDVIMKEIRNEEPEYFGVKPLGFLIDLESDAFTEKGGRKLLFKVGELIGQQIQMYQEKERKLPLENEFMRSYFRTINIIIPEGYKVANPEDLIINNSFIRDGKELLLFKSNFELNDNTLSITADEHYRINIIDTLIFEDYRKVINSAADFNKITLILEPLD